MATMISQTDFAERRWQLVENELRKSGIDDERVLQAMLEVPREEFVASPLRNFAYRNVALPIESGQTISQPWIVARMIAALQLKPSDRILEVGAGSGYAAAVASCIAKEVYAIERLQSLVVAAELRLIRLGFDNVRVLFGDGTQGYPDRAPYDAILVSACGPQIPKPLLQQLRLGGRMVIPVITEHDSQEIVRITRCDEHRFHRKHLGFVRFVPLIGDAGWPCSNESGVAL